MRIKYHPHLHPSLQQEKKKSTILKHAHNSKDLTCDTAQKIRNDANLICYCMKDNLLWNLRMINYGSARQGW